MNSISYSILGLLANHWYSKTDCDSILADSMILKKDHAIMYEWCASANATLLKGEFVDIPVDYSDNTTFLVDKLAEPDITQAELYAGLWASALILVDDGYYPDIDRLLYCVVSARDRLESWEISLYASILRSKSYEYKCHSEVYEVYSVHLTAMLLDIYNNTTSCAKTMSDMKYLIDSMKCMQEQAKDKDELHLRIGVPPKPWVVENPTYYRERLDKCVKSDLNSIRHIAKQLLDTWDIASENTK